MTLFDTHCHFDPGDDIAGLVARARAAGLTGLLVCGGDGRANEGALLAARLAPGFALPALGFGPDAIRAGETGDGPVPATAAAVGEIGLDYSHGETAQERAAQRKLFASQMRMAAEAGLPCSVHCREAQDDVVAILREFVRPDLAAAGRSGALHCFTGPVSFAEKLVPLGWCFGLSGILTFHSAGPLRSAVPALPRDRIVLETDSPYLAPEPLRGKTCEPAFVAHTARVLAEVLRMEPEEAAALATANARRLFASA